MFDIVDFLEPIIQGNWKYLGGLVLGILLLLIIRVVRLLWVERQTKKTMSLSNHIKVLQ